MKDQIKSLKKLGLTVQQAKIYLLLTKEGELSAKIIAEKCRILPNAVYRVLYQLDSFGLIRLSSRTPLKYIISPIEYSLSKLSEIKKNEIEKSLNSLVKLSGHKKSTKETEIELSSDKMKLFEESERMTNESKEEVLLISIGEPTTTGIILANKKAIERGVKIKVIYHKYDEENKDLIENLKKNGLEIRHLKDWGYHLQIFDAKKCLLSINNPKKTDERANILIQSKYLSKAFRDYFYLLWEKAVPV